jgi:hypothetical protein
LTGHAVEPAEALTAHARLARASAALGWERTFEAAWNAAWACLWCAGLRAQAAALLELARGAAQFGYWVRVQLAADLALELAGAARDGDEESGTDPLNDFAGGVVEAMRGALGPCFTAPVSAIR